MPVITITRGSLSATYKLTSRLSSELHCPVISRKEIIEQGKKYGIEEFLLAAQKIMESKPPHSWDPHAAQIHHFLAIFKVALLDFVVQGDIIYHGLQTHFLLTDVPRILRIKAVAPMEYRIKTLMTESGLSEMEAREHILNVDSQRVSWSKFLYGEDFDDMTTYDMILNMSNLNLDAMVDLIIRLTHRPEFRLDAGSMRQIKNAHLKSRVLAELVRSPKTRDIDFSVTCDSDAGIVKITDMIHSDISANLKNDIENALENIDSISRLEVTCSD